jgi:hypothetical protein
LLNWPSSIFRFAYEDERRSQNIPFLTWTQRVEVIVWRVSALADVNSEAQEANQDRVRSFLDQLHIISLHRCRVVGLATFYAWVETMKKRPWPLMKVSGKGDKKRTHVSRDSVSRFRQALMDLSRVSEALFAVSAASRCSLGRGRGLYHAALCEIFSFSEERTNETLSNEIETSEDTLPASERNGLRSGNMQPVS